MKFLTEGQKLKLARLIGSSYFVALALINFGATYLYAQLREVDFIILVFGCLPALANTKTCCLIFGSAAALIAMLMGLACLQFNLTPGISTSQLEFNMGYLLTASMFVSSLLLVYAGRPTFVRDILFE